MGRLGRNWDFQKLNIVQAVLPVCSAKGVILLANAIMAISVELDQVLHNQLIVTVVLYQFKMLECALLGTNVQLVQASPFHVNLVHFLHLSLPRVRNVQKDFIAIKGQAKNK